MIFIYIFKRNLSMQYGRNLGSVLALQKRDRNDKKKEWKVK